MPNSHTESSSPDPRLAALEMTVAHLERNYDALNSVVVEQGKWIARLQKRLEQVDATVQNQDSDRGPAQNVKPPHYQ